jgi:hypothetical protein
MRVLTLSSGKAARVENTLEELAAISVRYRLTKRLEGLFFGTAETAAPVAVKAVVSPSRRPPAPRGMLMAEVVAGDSDDNCD